MRNNHYNRNSRQFAQELRTETVSRSEKYLWKHVLSRNQQGVKFKRHRPILHFIVDFFAQEIGLIIEIDGNSHLNKGDYDKMRQNKLEALGYTIIRFSEGNVINEFGRRDYAGSACNLLFERGQTALNFLLPLNPPPKGEILKSSLILS